MHKKNKAPEHVIRNNVNKFAVLNTDDNDSDSDDWKAVKKSTDRVGNEKMERVDESNRYIGPTPTSPKMYVELSADDDNGIELGNNLFLNAPWTVWIHKSDCQTWTEESYTNIYVINSIGSFWRFFNNFHSIDKVKNQLFIMRNKIKPIWEDNENKNGGICSLKIDCYSRQIKSDIGIDVMICLCLMIMNETFISNTDQEINGLSYTVKNKSVLIKLWCKNFSSKINDRIPKCFFNKLESMLASMSRSVSYSSNYSYHTNHTNHSGHSGHSSHSNRHNENKLSIRYTEIKPEYD